MSTNNRITDNLTTEQVIDRVFRDPEVKYGLTEFNDLGKRPEEALNIFPKFVDTGRDRGVRYYLKDLKRGVDIPIYSEKRSNPEEIVRQLWIYKLHHVYGYPIDNVAIEHPI